MRPRKASPTIESYGTAMKLLFEIRGRDASAAKVLVLPPVSWLLAAIFITSSPAVIAAEGPVSAVQDVLKKEQFLSGEPSGVMDEATHAALLRFQIRRGLPPTGEIDTATLQALQSKSEVAQPAPQARPKEPKEPGPTEKTVEKDREFLRKVETGREQVPPKYKTSLPSGLPLPEQAQVPALIVHPPLPTPAGAGKLAPPPASPVASNPSKSDDLKRKSGVQKSEPAPLADGKASPSRREMEPEFPKAPPGRPKPRNSPSSTRIAESEDDLDPLGPHGVRIIRTTTTTTGPDGRTIISEKKTGPFAGTPTPEVRRAEPVTPRPRDNGFLHRLFSRD
jgi:hypothetical protein